MTWSRAWRRGLRTNVTQADLQIRQPAASFGLLALFWAWVVYLLSPTLVAYPQIRALPSAIGAAARDCAEGCAHLPENSLHILGCVLAFSLFAADVWALGAFAQRRWFKDLAAEDRAFVQLGLGAVLLEFVLFALGIAGLWHPWILRSLAVALAAWGLVPELRKQGLAGLRIDWRPRARPWSYHLALAFILLALVEALVPETGADAGMYHVGVPNAWRLDHRIHFLPDHYASNLPLPQSMFYGLLLSLGPSDSTKLLQPVACLLAAATLFRLVERRVGPHHFPLEVWTLLAVPALNGYLAISGNDQLTIFAGAVAALLAFEAGFAPTSPDLASTTSCVLGAALLLGFAASGKYTAWPPALLLGLILAFGALSRGVGRGSLAAAAALFLLPILMWSVKAAVWTGDPVFPAGAEWFGSAVSDPAGIARAIDTNVPKQVDLVAVLQMPWRVAFEASAPMHASGPHFVAILPLTLVVTLLQRRRARALAALALVTLLWVVWALLYTNARYSGLIFLVSGLAASILLHPLTAGPGRLALAWRATLLVVLGAATLAGWAYRVDLVRPYTYLCGAKDRLGYVLDQDLPMTVAPPDGLYDFLNRSLDPEKHRVLIVGESRTAGIKIPFVSGCEYDRPVFERFFRERRDLVDAEAALSAAGVTHVAISLAAGRMFEGYSFRILTAEPASQQLWLDFLEHRTTVVAQHQEGEEDWVVLSVVAGDSIAVDQRSRLAVEAYRRSIGTGL